MVFGYPVMEVVEQLMPPIHEDQWALLRVLAVPKERATERCDHWLVARASKWVAAGSEEMAISPERLRQASPATHKRIDLTGVFTSARSTFGSVSVIAALFWGDMDESLCALLTTASYADSQDTVDLLGGPDDLLPRKAEYQDSTGVRPVFFNSNYMGDEENCYVCWLDVMGTHNQMLRSLHTSANFIYKLQCAVLQAYDELGDTSGIGLYPVMDGIYITAKRRWPMDALLKPAMRRLAETFCTTREHKHRFLVRGAIAFGPTYHGRKVTPRASNVLAKHPRERDSVLLGLPMAQAYQAERTAPPFGIAVGESARAFGADGDAHYRFVWWNWFQMCDHPLDVPAFIRELEDYFEWQTNHCNMTGYDPKRIEHHRKLAREYLG